MSKLIVEMDMPRACRWYEDGTKKRCPIAEWGGACAVTKLFEPFDDNRPSWCPISGVLLDEHGDLVDRDEVKQKMIYHGFRSIDMTATEFCEDELQTVIAAERRKAWDAKSKA